MRDSGKEISSVSQVNQYIKNMFVREYALQNIYMKGEVSNCKYHTSGHIYFTLKDRTSQISCVMFAGQRKGLTFRMTEGQSVIALGSVSVYERDGKYQFYAREIRQDGAGLLYEKYEELKKRLLLEGLFDESNKKKIPFYVSRIGVVTASTGAAIQDIINITSRRNPYVQLVLYPAKVQGEGAALSVAKGIAVLDRQDVDVIIVGRGGGSIEDLWAFNEEIVARAIYDCKTPVISAVGHETDTTIADYVADLRAPTPSAAAELAVYSYEAVAAALDDFKWQLGRGLHQCVQRTRERLSRYKLLLEKGSPDRMIFERRQYLVHTEKLLSDLMWQTLERRKHQMELYVEKLKGLSPLYKLSGGYSYIADDAGNSIKSVSQIKQGDRLHVNVTDGSFDAEVIQIQQKDGGVWNGKEGRD